MSSTCRISSLSTSICRARADACSSRISRTASGKPALNIRPKRRTAGTTSSTSWRRLPGRSGSCVERPVMLPLGRARLATRPAPTGSFESAKMIGMTDVARFAAMIPVPAVTMTSTFRWVNSAAMSVKRSFRLSAHRNSMLMLRPSIHPSSRSRPLNGATHSAQAPGVLVPINPIVGRCPACYARATSGHATAALPVSVMNSRRFMCCPQSEDCTLPRHGRKYRVVHRSKFGGQCLSWVDAVEKGL
jgi:hypothetical protein